MKIAKLLRGIMLLALILIGLHVQAYEEIKQSNFFTTTTKKLLLSALDNDGEAVGNLNDAAAMEIRRKFNLQPDAIVQGVVSTVNIINDQCSRLHLTINVPDAQVSRYLGADPEMLSVWYEINLCRDGKPPTDTVSDVINRYSEGD